jgi:hypothetical protein
MVCDIPVPWLSLLYTIESIIPSLNFSGQKFKVRALDERLYFCPFYGKIRKNQSAR